MPLAVSASRTRSAVGEQVSPWRSGLSGADPGDACGPARRCGSTRNSRPRDVAARATCRRPVPRLDGRRARGSASSSTPATGAGVVGRRAAMHARARPARSSTTERRLDELDGAARVRVVRTSTRLVARGDDAEDLEADAGELHALPRLVGVDGVGEDAADRSHVLLVLTPGALGLQRRQEAVVGEAAVEGRRHGVERTAPVVVDRVAAHPEQPQGRGSRRGPPPPASVSGWASRPASGPWSGRLSRSLSGPASVPVPGAAPVRAPRPRPRSTIRTSRGASSSTVPAGRSRSGPVEGEHGEAVDGGPGEQLGARALRRGSTPAVAMSSSVSLEQLEGRAPAARLRRRVRPRAGGRPARRRRCGRAPARPPRSGGSAAPTARRRAAGGGRPDRRTARARRGASSAMRVGGASPVPRSRRPRRGAPRGRRSAGRPRSRETPTRRVASRSTTLSGPPSRARSVPASSSARRRSPWW